jgi:hypothetical protein
MNKKLCCLVAVLAGVSSGMTLAATPASGVVVDPIMKAEEAVLRAKVVEIDLKTRSITLQADKNPPVSFHVPADVPNLDKVKVGDTVVLRYVSAMVASVTRGTAGGIREKVETRQGGTVNSRRSTEVIATILSIDTKHRKLTLRGPSRVVVVDVPKEVDIQSLKIGDEVRALIIEATAVSLEPQTSPVK